MQPSTPGLSQFDFDCLMSKSGSHWPRNDILFIARALSRGSHASQVPLE